MLINKYVNFRKLYSAPLAIKSERQLDFSQPIELAMGCSLTLPKLKNKNPLDSALLAIKKTKDNSALYNQLY